MSDQNARIITVVRRDDRIALDYKRWAARQILLYFSVSRMLSFDLGLGTMKEPLRRWLMGHGWQPDQADLLVLTLYLILVLLSAWLSRWLLRLIMFRVVSRFLRHSKVQIEQLVEHRVLWRVADFAPTILIWTLAPWALADYPHAVTFVQRAAEIYALFAGLLVVNSLLSTFDSVYRELHKSGRAPITTIIQSLKLFFTLAVGLLAISILLQKSPWTFLTGIGAVSAVVVLIFRDTILGFVAGIALAANDLVAPGDWIQMDKFGANGTVLDITLTTVKVRNFDNTITMIPAYALVTDYFINWRGMSQTGARRIKRAVNVDVSSVCFCTPELYERLSGIELLRARLEQAKKEIEIKQEPGTDGLLHQRRLTNLGIFRAYLVAYLHDHPNIDQTHMIMVRQLEPTEKGVPLELYAFANDTDWLTYEGIQSDIFDHVLAVIREFDLRPFQFPSGNDFGSESSAV